MVSWDFKTHRLNALVRRAQLLEWKNPDISQRKGSEAAGRMVAVLSVLQASEDRR